MFEGFFGGPREKKIDVKDTDEIEYVVRYEREAEGGRDNEKKWFNGLKQLDSAINFAKDNYSSVDFEIEINGKTKSGFVNTKTKEHYIFEAKSNYTMENMPDGEYAGSVKGYEVYMDGIDSGFRATTGYRNAFPIKCHVVVKDGTAVAYSRHGVLFSDEKTEKAWKEKYGSLDKDPNFAKYKKELE